MDKKKPAFETLAVHAGIRSDEAPFSTLPPVAQSASHRFGPAEEMTEAFAGRSGHPIYMRLRNPTNAALEARMTALENGAKALAVGSGMAAVSETAMGLLRSGDHMVASRSLFMSTYVLFNQLRDKYNVEATFVAPRDPRQVEEAVRENTRMVYLETIGNPALDVPDLAAIAEIAAGRGLPLVVDNTLASPWLCRPLELGADIVLHSTTKFLNGHGSALGGVIVDGGSFAFPEDRFPDFKPWKERAGKTAFLDKVYREVHVNFGAAAAPWHSFLTLIGIDTLALRMERHCRNALALAEYLAGHPRVKSVNYPGLESSPSREQARRLFQGRGFGGLLTFDLGDEARARHLVDSLELVYHLANLGDCKTLIIHPWSSQYVNFPEAKRLELGISPGMLRVSVGIENIDDIVADFDRALGGRG